MFNSDAIAYIPLFGTVILGSVLFVFMGIIKARKTAKVSYLSFLALSILIGGSFYTACHPGITHFVLIILLACAVMIPYVIMLAFGKPKQEPPLEAIPEVKAPEVIIEDVKPEEVSLIEKGRAFVTLASDSFGNKDGLQTVLDCINKTCIDITRADGGAVLMVDDFEDSITVKSFMGNFPPPYKLPDGLPHKELRVSTSFKFANFPLRDNIFGEVASSGKSELINSPLEDSRIFQNGPEAFLKLGSLIFIPIRLRGKGIVIGLLALSRDNGKEGFTQQEYDWALTLAGFAESALKTVISFSEYNEKNDISKESKVAESLQNILLPKKLPLLKGISFGSYTSHTEGVCADCFDVIPVKADRTSFLLLDVAGKGTNSFLVMSMIRAMIRLLINTPQGAGTILSLANREICGETNFEHFSSAALINFNPVTKQVQVATAGTTPVLLYSAAKQTIEKKSVIMEPIGVEKTTTYKDIQFTVSTGDIIITYTDGLVEALNSTGKQYSLDRLSNLVKTNSKLPGKDLANLVKTDIKKFIGSEVLHDDQTLLVVKIQ